MYARFIVDGPFVKGDRITLRGDEGHHAARVARVRTGERVEIFDGKGAAAEATVLSASRDVVELEAGDSVTSREAPVEIVLAAALIMPDKYELVLQKGCELGVSRFVPVLSTRVERRVERIHGKCDRWTRIILEATKQCGRTVLPVLDAPAEFTQVITSERGLIVFDADAEPDPWPRKPQQSVTLIVGPEGGLTPAEVDAARDAGATVCSLGPRRLRAESAAIAAVTIAGSLFGDLMPR